MIRNILCIVLLSFLVATPAVARGPNVVLILVDDMGWRDWSGAGNEICVTPNIDRLARDGIQFRQAYAACAVCSPTRAAVQTGRYPARVGVTDWIRSQFQRPGGKTPASNPTEFVGGPRNRLLCPPNPFWMESSEVTLAELLKTQDYRTAYIGKWHLGDADWFPEKQGYDVNFGGCDYGQPPSYFDPFNQPKGRHPTLQKGIFKLPGRNPGEYLTDRETDEACKLIRAWKDSPFFIQLAHYAVHTPLQAPKSDIDKYRREGVTGAQATYGAMVESVDRALGKIRSVLQELNLEEDTVIWFTSDNGGLDNRGNPTENLPLRQGKGHPYEGGIRVPTLVSWKDRIPAGSVSESPTSSIDILPTLSDWCGVKIPKAHVLDGISMTEHIQSGGSVDIPSRALLWHFPHYRGSISPYSILRDGEYKLLHYFEGRSELYNVVHDIGEENDLASEMPQQVRRMTDKLLSMLNDMNAKIPVPNPNYQPK